VINADMMADALAWFLNNEDSLKAEFVGLGEIEFTNEDGDKFLITLTKPEDDRCCKQAVNSPGQLPLIA